MADTLVNHESIAQAAVSWAGRGVQWWLSNFYQAVPQAWLEWAARDAQPTVLILRRADAIICRLVTTSETTEVGFPAEQFRMNVLLSWLGERGVARDQVVVQPLISGDVFFRRQMNVPKSALQALPQILDQELQRKTPFQLPDVWHAGQISNDATGEVATVSHWIVRKDRAIQALANLGLDADDVDCISIDESSPQAMPSPLIAFRPRPNDDPVWALRAVRLLALAGCLLPLFAFILFEWSQSSVAASVEDALIEARQAAQSGQDGVDPAVRLLALKADSGIVGAIDELSRILPDHTFLRDLRIADGKITISGFSADAPRLVRLIDQSRIFSGAALAAAITPDANERKDRFTINFKIRGARALKFQARPRSSS